METSNKLQNKENLNSDTTILSNFIYKKQLSDYKGKEIIYTTELYFSASFPFEFLDHKIILTEDDKTNVIPMFINNFILLNTTATPEQIFNVVNFKLKKLYYTYVSDKFLYETIDKIYTNKENLQPINQYYKDRWINPECKNKLALYQKARSEESLVIIEYFFNVDIKQIHWKITLDLTAKYTGLNVRTIKRRITPDQKELIKQHNQLIKEINANLIKEYNYIKQN